MSTFFHLSGFDVSVAFVIRSDDYYSSSCIKMDIPRTILSYNNYDGFSNSSMDPLVLEVKKMLLRNMVDMVMFLGRNHKDILERLSSKTELFKIKGVSSVIHNGETEELRLQLNSRVFLYEETSDNNFTFYETYSIRQEMNIKNKLGTWTNSSGLNIAYQVEAYVMSDFVYIGEFPKYLPVPKLRERRANFEYVFLV